MNNALEIIGLNAGYGSVQILFDLDITVHEKEIAILIGANGTGKSTVLKAIMGLVTVYSGKIKFKDKDITQVETHKIAKLGIGYMPQVENIWNSLTVIENLNMAAYTIEKSRIQDRLELCLQIFPFLKDKMKRLAGTMSGGEKQMLAMSMVIMRDPKILVVDEPTAGLMPKSVIELLNKFSEMRDILGLPIFIVEQRARIALEIGDKAYLMRDGKVKFEGTAEELLNHPHLHKMYFGLV